MQILDPRVRHVFDVLRTNLFDFMVAGGYARDCAHGVIPKDLDICVFNRTPDDPAEKHLTGMLYKALLKVEGIASLTVHGTTEYTCDDDTHWEECISYVWTLTFPRDTIDIIFYQPHLKTRTAVLNSFDCNMNMHATRVDRDWLASSGGQQIPDTLRPIEFCGSHKGTLKFLRELTPERREKMCHRAGQIGWKLETSPSSNKGSSGPDPMGFDTP